MAADIDDFIRNQKLRMVEERERLGPGPVQNGGRAAPVRRHDQVGAILKEDVPHPQDGLAGVGVSVEKQKALIDGRDGGAALPGLGERHSSQMRRDRARLNNEYNAFKAAEDAKFRDRFAGRKPQQQPPPAPRQHPQYAPQRQPPPPQQQQPFANGFPPGGAPAQFPPPPPPPQQYPNAPGPGPGQYAPMAPQFAAPPPQPGYNGAPFGGYQPSALPPPAGPGPDADYDRQLDTLERTVRELREQVSRRGPRPVPSGPPPQPRQGWATPDYGDLVAAKRREEARRHRLEDPELFGALIADQERRLEVPPDDEAAEDLDAQLHSQKSQLLSRRPGPRRRAAPDFMEDDDAWLRLGAVPDLEGSLNNLDARQRDRRQLVPGPGRRRGPGQRGGRDEGGPMGSLPVGHEERVSAKQRRQSTYRDELQRQMAEQKAAKTREAQERRAAPPAAQQKQQTAAGLVHPENISQLPAMPIQPGIENLPSLSAYNTPADDAYFYYGSKNPLEDDLLDSSAGQPLLPNPRAAVPVTGRAMAPSGVPGDAPATSRVANRTRMQGASVDNPMAPGGGDPRDAERRRKAEYAAELQRQMEEAAAARQRRKKEQEEFDRKKDAEIAEYYPFESRHGGGGEPIKVAGEVVADLRRGAPQASARAPQASSRAPEAGELRLRLSGSFGAGREAAPAPAAGPGSQRTPRQVNALGEATHARGGHGVFGQPKTDEEKAKTDNYKEQLRLQIEERKRQKEEEERRAKEQEERDMRRVEEQAKRIQMEFEAEQQRQKEKVEEVKKKNEEMWQEAEARKRQDAERRRARPGPKQDDSLLPPPPPQPRGDSPPIPTLKKNQPPRSPPIPTLKRQQRSGQRPPSAAGKPPKPETSRRESQERPDVLRQLERMKKELQNERVKVEDALKGSPPPTTQPDRDRYEVVPVSGRGRRSRASDIDVFELARQGRSGPVVVRTQRPREDLADADVLREFRNLRLRDNEVGRNVRQEHPGTPLTSNQLEIQQNTYLRQQHEFIRDMQGRPIVMERYQSPAVRSEQDPTPLPMRPALDDHEIASQYSFDVDNLNQRTDERMRRLSRMNPDGVSLQDQDELLNRFMSQRTHTTNEAERAPSVRNRETSYDLPTHGVKQTSMGVMAQDDRATSYHAPSPGIARLPSEDSAVHDPVGPTPVDDTWLNPTRRRG